MFRFFEEYAKNGINFWGTSIQNEPGTGIDPTYVWQTMSMTPEMESQFLGKILGPALKGNNITKDLKIMVYSDQRDTIIDYTKQVSVL